jgi:hypothetical protein
VHIGKVEQSNGAIFISVSFKPSLLSHGLLKSVPSWQLATMASRQKPAQEAHIILFCFGLLKDDLPFY